MRDVMATLNDPYLAKILSNRLLFDKISINVTAGSPSTTPIVCQDRQKYTQNQKSAPKNDKNSPQIGKDKFATS